MFSCQSENFVHRECSDFWHLLAVGTSTRKMVLKLSSLRGQVTRGSNGACERTLSMFWEGNQWTWVRLIRDVSLRNLLTWGWREKLCPFVTPLTVEMATTYLFKMLEIRCLSKPSCKKEREFPPWLRKAPLIRAPWMENRFGITVLVEPFLEAFKSVFDLIRIPYFLNLWSLNHQTEA